MATASGPHSYRIATNTLGGALGRGCPLWRGSWHLAWGLLSAIAQSGTEGVCVSWSNQGGRAAKSQPKRIEDGRTVVRFSASGGRDEALGQPDATLSELRVMLRRFPSVGPPPLCPGRSNAGLSDAILSGLRHSRRDGICRATVGTQLPRLPSCLCRGLDPEPGWLIPDASPVREGHAVHAE